jgi:hypothetical protein
MSIFSFHAYLLLAPSRVCDEGVERIRAQGKGTRALVYVTAYDFYTNLQLFRLVHVRRALLGAKNTQKQKNRSNQSCFDIGVIYALHHVKRPRWKSKVRLERM